MEGQSEDCPFRRIVGHLSRIRFLPQWRGSRKTARFVIENVPPAPIRPAAMEGQSEDCPFPNQNHPASDNTKQPQWRGSRKTARFDGSG